MKWSWKLGRIAGIDLYVHSTFLILLAWVGAVHYMQRQLWVDVVAGLAFIAALFGIVVLHELGHALMARRFGIPTRDITLLPIGGVARLERMPREPKKELLVALAGPAVNVVLAVICFALLVPVSGLTAISDVALVGGGFLAKLMWINVALAVFNLFPAFPMDGGRVLRAILAMRMDYVLATQSAASVGQMMALMFGFIGLMSNPFLLFVALFVWMGATQEASEVAIKSGLSGIPVQCAMVTRFLVMSPRDSLSHAVEAMLAGFQHDFPVIDNGRLVGVLTRDDVVKAIANLGQRVPVAEVMQTEFETVDAGDMLETALEKMQSCDCHTLPVVFGSQLVGILNKENISEFLMFRPHVELEPQAPIPVRVTPRQQNHRSLV